MKKDTREKLEQNKQHLEEFKKSNKYLELNDVERPKGLSVTSSGSLAFNIAIELISASIVGVIIGLFLDKMFDSKPVMLIMCLCMSSIAGFWSVWKKYVKIGT